MRYGASVVVSVPKKQATSLFFREEVISETSCVSVGLRLRCSLLKIRPFIPSYKSLPSPVSPLGNLVRHQNWRPSNWVQALRGSGA